MPVSSPLALLSAGAVVLAGVAFVATNSQQSDRAVQVSAPATSTGTPTTPAATADRPVIRHKKAHKKAPPKKPPVRRGDTFVEVFNNSGISGLAGSTAARAQGAGWQVVGSDNWYGTIPASTVYYPARLREQATLLGKDLGIGRLRPMIAPMRGDRLTVILTRDYS